MVPVAATGTEHVCTFLPDFSPQIPADTRREDWGEKTMITARGEQNSVCSLLSLLTPSQSAALRAPVKIHHTQDKNTGYNFRALGKEQEKVPDSEPEVIILAMTREM